jgi:uncharacterized protein (DUF433 family)
MKLTVISCSPDVMGGRRVPVQTPLDHLEARETVDAFLAGFPVTRDQVIAFWKKQRID